MPRTMGEVVAAFGVPHAPGLRAWPQAAPAEQLGTIEQGFATLRAHVELLKPDAIVVVAAEHWANFSLANMPCFCIGVAEEHDGPVEEWLKVPRRTFPGASALAKAMVEGAFRDGVDVAYSHELHLDHGTIVPLTYLTPDFDVPVVPIIQNCLVAP